MDAPRTDVESCALLKHARGCKLTLFLALQNVLLTGCLLAALYVYWTGTGQTELKDNGVYITFEPTAEFYGDKTVEFITQSQHKMNLSDSKRISTECAGPYILHMYVCYETDEGKANGTLQLQVAGKTESLCTFELHGSSDKQCRRLQNIVYLRKEEETELRLRSPNIFTIKELEVGLNYLASKCKY